MYLVRSQLLERDWVDIADVCVHVLVVPRLAAAFLRLSPAALRRHRAHRRPRGYWKHQARLLILRRAEGEVGWLVYVASVARKEPVSSLHRGSILSLTRGPRRREELHRRLFGRQGQQ